MKLRILSLLYIVTLLLGGMYVKYLQTTPPKIEIKKVVVTKTVIKKPKEMLLSVTQNDLKKDLQTTYSFLSQNQQKEVLDAILSSSKEFNINPLIIYSLVNVESSFRFWAVSQQRTVSGSDGKKHKDNALGLMSIMYSIHNKALKEAGIISTKTELRQIKPNIRAGTFILAKMRKQYKGNMDKALKAYFGFKSKFAPTYLRRIKTKFGSLAYSKIKE